MSESQNVAPAVESTTNKFTMLTLKPGESHSAKLELYRNPYYNRSITFRLGFVPDFDRAVSAIYINKIAEIYWSNSVTLPK
jgi:hypothetical protein